MEGGCWSLLGKENRRDHLGGLGGSWDRNTMHHIDSG